MSNPFIARLTHAADLTPIEIAKVEELCGPVSLVGAKRYVASGGEHARSLPVLMSGWAAHFQILRDGARQITRVLLPGDVFHLDTPASYAASEETVTLTRCTITHLRLSEFAHATAAHPAIGEAMRSYAAMQNAILANWVVNVGRRDALQRIANLICELQCRMALVEQGIKHYFCFPLTQDDLADALGLTPVHVNRKLQQLRQDGLITLHARQLTILDPPRLREIAGFNDRYLRSRARTLCSEALAA